MESIEIYNLVKCAQRETKRTIHKKIADAFFLEQSRMVGKNDKGWTRAQQGAYIKALENVLEIIISTN